MHLDKEDSSLTPNIDRISTELAAATRRLTPTTSALATAQQPVAQADATLRLAPPAELASHIETAARAWDALRSNSQQVSFSESPDGRIHIELQDQDGNHLETLSGVGLFDLIDQAGAR